MTIQEYLSEKSLRVLDSRIKERAVVENLRTSFFLVATVLAITTDFSEAKWTTFTERRT